MGGTRSQAQPDTRFGVELDASPGPPFTAGEIEHLLYYVSDTAGFCPVCDSVREKLEAMRDE